MVILYSVICALVVIIAIAIQMQKQIRAGGYVWRNFILISVAWLALILPGIRSTCSDVFCKWSVSFAWWTRPLYEVSPFDWMSPSTILTIAIVAVSVVTVYFFGHVLGWLLYGARRLFRLAA